MRKPTKNKIDVAKLKEQYKKVREENSKVIHLTKELFMEHFENHPLFVAFFNFVSNNELTPISVAYKQLKTRLMSNESYWDEVDSDTLSFVVKWGRILKTEVPLNKESYVQINQEGELVKFVSVPYIYLLEKLPTIREFEKSYNEFIEHIKLEDVPQDFISLVSSMFKLISVKPLKVEVEDDYIESNEIDYDNEIDAEVLNGDSETQQHYENS